MINFLFKRDFFAIGLVFSLGWHFFWVVLMVPVLPKQTYTAYANRSIFLGSILKKEDLSFKDSADERRPSGPLSGIRDFSRDGYFKKSDDLFVKPKAARGSSVGILAPERARPVDVSRVALIRGSIQFGLLDYSNYLDRVEFAELKRISTREDISDFLDFRVFLGAAGAVRDIKKTSGSGDPALDLYIMRKLKNAIFKESFAQGEWLGVRFRIKG
jgi:hypothetical protein